MREASTATPAYAVADVPEDHVFRLVPEYRPGYGLSVFAFLPPPPVPEPPPD